MRVLFGADAPWCLVCLWFGGLVVGGGVCGVGVFGVGGVVCGGAPVWCGVLVLWCVAYGVAPIVVVCVGELVCW